MPADFFPQRIVVCPQEYLLRPFPAGARQLFGVFRQVDRHIARYVIFFPHILLLAAFKIHSLVKMHAEKYAEGSQIAQDIGRDLPVHQAAVHRPVLRFVKNQAAVRCDRIQKRQLLQRARHLPAPAPGTGDHLDSLLHGLPQNPLQAGRNLRAVGQYGIVHIKCNQTKLLCVHVFLLRVLSDPILSWKEWIRKAPENTKSRTAVTGFVPY